MSQTAAMRTFGILASDCIKVRQRPPVPMQPTLSVSFAPSALTAGIPNAASPAATPAEVFSMERRETSWKRVMETPWGQWVRVLLHLVILLLRLVVLLLRFGFLVLIELNLGEGMH